MIEPTKDDVGRSVINTGNRHHGVEIEEFEITSFNELTVFVRYKGDQHAKATSRSDLEWSHA